MPWAWVGHPAAFHVLLGILGTTALPVPFTHTASSARPSPVSTLLVLFVSTYSAIQAPCPTRVRQAPTFPASHVLAHWLTKTRQLSEDTTGIVHLQGRDVYSSSSSPPPHPPLVKRQLAPSSLATCKL